MKKLLLALAAVAVARVGFAVDPVAIWDGDFGTSVKTGTDGKTYTLTLPTGAESWIQSDGSLKVGGGTKSAYVNLQDGDSYNLAQGTKLSVLMEYENATAQSVAACPIYLQADSYFGLKTKASTLEVVGDGWGTTYPTSGDTVTTMPPSGSILLVYPQGDGDLKVYSASTREGLTDASAGGAITALKYSNKRLQKIGLGGCFTDGSGQGLTNFTNLVIKRVAIYTSAITTDAAAAYIFPSEIQTINVDSGTTVSAINAQIDSENYKAAAVSVADGVTIEVNEAFDSKIRSVSSAGTITLAAETAHDASFFSGVDFSGVKGGLLRSWLTPGVVGFNFRSANGSDVSGALATTDNWIHDNNSASGTSTSMFADGLSTLTWSSGGTWACSGSTIISGYLDDGANGGNGATVTLSNVPYETYDVIVYCSSDSNPGKFLAKTVNGTTYTWDSAAGAVVAGNAAWGKAALSTPVYGVNALRIKNQSGPLTIYGSARNGSNRGGIAAIQIMPPDTPDNIKTYTLTLGGTATTWSEGAWTLNDETVDAPTSGYVEIVATASTALTVDSQISLNSLKFKGGEGVVMTIAIGDGGSIYSISAVVESGVLQQGSDNALGTTPTVVVEDGATFDMNGHAVSSSSAFYINGAGAGDWPWALTSSSGAGEAILGGLYLTGNATIGGKNEMKIGQNGNGYYLYLQGHTLTKVGEGALTGTNMNTPGSGTIDVQGGAMSLNQWNNLNSGVSGDTTIILREGASLANNTDRTLPMGTLKLLGGTLSTSSQAFKVNTLLTGGGETAKFVFADGASASLTGNFTVTSALTLDGATSFMKHEDAVADVVVDIAGTLAASGVITVGSGVTLNLRTNRPTVQLAFSDDAALAVQLMSDFDVVSLSASARPSSMVVYDAEGEVTETVNVFYENGTLTIMPMVPTLPVAAGGVASFETDWLSLILPDEGGDAIIDILSDSEHSGATEITVDDRYVLGNLTITGEGEVFFTGEGSISVTNIYVKNGASLVHDAGALSVESIILDAGTVLKIDGITESAAISGAGAVETYGEVVMAAANSMTGGITVKPGSSLSTSVAPVWENASTKVKCNCGFGPYNIAWPYSDLSRVVVEDGGCVDINNVANKDAGVALTISGKGILNDGVYLGAVIYSGSSTIGNNSRQISSLSLAADAMVDVGPGWGLVHSSHGAAGLALEGHTLTMRGTGTVPMVNVNASGSSGTLVMDGATLELSNRASNFSGVDIILDGCASVNLTASPSALGSLTVKPTVDGTTASAWNLPASPRPVVNTVNVDFSGLSVDETITLLTVPSSVTLSSDNISVVASGRYEPVISGNTVKVRVKEPSPFLHYDFNAGAAADTGAAGDAVTTISDFIEADSVTQVKTRNGKAVQVHTNYTPYWGFYENEVSPFRAGEITVAGVFRLRETGIVLWGLGSAADGKALGIVATSANSLDVLAKGASGVQTLATVENTADLTGGWHFFAVVANASGTVLYVDGLSDSSDKAAPFDIGQQGQLGSFHGGAGYVGGNKVGDAGYLLDDWRVYDAAFTESEVVELRRKMNPPPFRLMIR